MIVAHLGNGASLCAMRDGKSVDTTMGFTTLDGLLMGTRPGTLDPGAVTYLMRQHAMTAGEVENMLYHRSGLLGVSGISSDMRTLLASDDEPAREVVDLFVFRAAREIGALAASLGGLDGLVFTAGIGEHAPIIRARICARCAWLGVLIDEDANRDGRQRIDAKTSRIATYVIPTDVVAYPAETTEAFCDGHVQVFAFFDAIPQSILYDNTKIAVARILGDGKRQRTRVFAELQSHYLFQDRFGRPAKGNDKGKVEGLIGFARRNFMVPVPAFESFEALNAHLAECCRKRMSERLRGHTETIGERLEQDLAAMRRPLLPPYDACEKVGTRVSSLSLVRYRRNDYSVPTSYGHHEVMVRGYVHEVVIACGTETIACHPRSHEREDFVFDPLHYLALIEQKINALDQAAPLADWQLPEEFATLRRLLEMRMGKPGKREFVQVLRLMETFRIEDVTAAVGDAIARGAIGFDAIKHLVLCCIERRPPRLDMAVYPYLPKATVATTSARDYMGLLAGAAS